eukprot:CAMPEP_0202385412 /NCGR_PEP_ID=MMETSP1127-20130417/60641_1 /ASSEMBLY_ACC=CAM_ASM_000462 /TAXON_ID=3047 /ORGANISM="Dunaliella tertiolecta, Strain CCMP1320" /LENGTH=147 /DNA_ID=CAMNT_0048985561 /DNA_START=553 /DNA_END=996 /DNA_ORIENTATION=-
MHGSRVHAIVHQKGCRGIQAEASAGEGGAGPRAGAPAAADAATARTAGEAPCVLRPFRCQFQLLLHQARAQRSCGYLFTHQQQQVLGGGAVCRACSVLLHRAWLTMHNCSPATLGAAAAHFPSGLAQGVLPGAAPMVHSCRSQQPNI